MSHTLSRPLERIRPSSRIPSKADIRLPDSRHPHPAPCDHAVLPVGAIGGRDDAVRRRCDLARAVAGMMLRVPAAALVAPGRSRQEVCAARHVGMYLAHVVFQLSLRAIAREFGRHRSSVGYAVRQVEARRDDGGFDALLTRHERQAEALRDQLAGGLR